MKFNEARRWGSPYRQKQLSHEIPSTRFEVVSLELLTGLSRTKDQNDSILLFIDNLTGRVYLAPCRKSLTSAQAAHQFIATGSGPLARLAQDNHQRRRHSRFLQVLFKMLQVHVKHLSPFAAHSNGHCERMIEALCIYPGADCDKYLPSLERPTACSSRSSDPADPHDENLDSIRLPLDASAEAARVALEAAALANEERLARVDDLVWLSTANLNLPDAPAKLNPRLRRTLSHLELVATSLALLPSRTWSST
eukprot:766350-Hanusia_phi.AAC.1